MLLRQLEMQDALLMLEWMHDLSVVRDLQTDFSKKTIEDCQKFILDSWTNTHNMHLAIVDDMGIYQGTVSLKNIENSTAEFAITIRSSAMGKGIGSDAMKEIIKIGFEEKELNMVYWCVSPDNKRAIKFYDKNGYHKVTPDTLNIRVGKYSKEQIYKYFWYLVIKDEAGNIIPEN